MRDLSLASCVAVFILACGLLLAGLYPTTQRDVTGNDIYYTWLEGERLVDGENPYSRIHGADMRRNRKYSTYLPGFYLLSAGTQVLGLETFQDWIATWRVVFATAHLTIGALIFYHSLRNGFLVLGMFGAAFWLFNRWSLKVLAAAHIEPLAILPLVCSILLIAKHRRAALLLFGVSLSVKQLALILLPAMLAWDLRSADTRRIPLQATTTLAWMLVVPVALSIPFLLWDAGGFLKSLLFSATRDPAGLFNAEALSSTLGLTGLWGRLPTLALMVALYWAIFRRQLGLVAGSFLLFVVFVTFNDVLFVQYLVWPAALLPIAAVERREAETSPDLSQLRHGAYLAPVAGGLALLLWSGSFFIRDTANDAGPWSVTYYSSRNFDGHRVHERSAAVQYDWQRKRPLATIRRDNFSVRWDTCLDLERDRELQITLTADDGAKIAVDGETVVDLWNRKGKTMTARVPLSAGIHHVRVAYFEKRGAASIHAEAALDGDVDTFEERLSFPVRWRDSDRPCGVAPSQ